MYSYNFNLKDDQTTDIEVLNRGLLYGDGFFETMNLVDGNIPLLPFHYQRIQKAHHVFGMTLDFSLDFLAEHLQKLCSVNNLREGRVKIIFWRKSGGFYLPTSTGSDIYITTSEHTPLPHLKKQAVVYTAIRNSFNPISSFKTLSAAKYVMAANYMRSKNADEVILLDELGYVSELLYSNIFWINSNQLFTPSLETGCIEGTMRAFLVENMNVKEGRFTVDEVKKADVCFSSNALGLIPINKIEETKLKGVSSLFEEIIKSLPF